MADSQTELDAKCVIVETTIKSDWSPAQPLDFDPTMEANPHHDYHFKSPWYKRRNYKRFPSNAGPELTIEGRDIVLNTCNRIPGWKGYRISRDGRLYVTGTCRINYYALPVPHRVIPSLNDGGYLRAALTFYDAMRGGLNTRHELIHRLVAMAYHGRRSPEILALHKDGVRTNNHADNVYWGDAFDNAADRIWHDKVGRGNGIDSHRPELRKTRKGKIQIVDVSRQETKGAE